MAGRERSCKRKHGLVSSKCQPVKIRKTASADTKLQHATGTGNIASVASILKTKSVSQSTLDACLLQTAKAGHRRVLQLLLQNGANVNTKDINDCTPLMLSSEHGFLDIVMSLIKHGADVRLKNKAGKTAFLLGVERACSSALLNYFLSTEANADVNDQDINGKTALMLSVEHWDIDAMEMLIRSKCTNLDLKDQDGKTAFQLAEKCGLGDVFTLLTECYRSKMNNLRPLKIAVKRKNHDLVRLMLDSDYSKINVPENTPLVAAFCPYPGKVGNKTSVDLEMVKILIDAGADVNKKSHGSPTLLYAVQTGNVEGIRLLVENGADLNQKSNFNEQTALMEASRCGHLDVVDFLIRNKADITLKDRWGFTALKYALETGKTECAKLLLESGIPTDEKMFNLAVEVGLDDRLFPNAEWNLAK